VRMATDSKARTLKSRGRLGVAVRDRFCMPHGSTGGPDRRRPQGSDGFADVPLYYEVGVG
jgi:hypothetical protein